MTVLGQVCCDSNGKLNSQSVLLEAGPDQGGRQVPVDLSELRDYSLFPGQVVVMEGMNTSGRKFVASKLFEVSGILLKHLCLISWILIKPIPGLKALLEILKLTSMTSKFLFLCLIV